MTLPLRPKHVGTLTGDQFFDFSFDASDSLFMWLLLRSYTTLVSSHLCCWAYY